MTMTLRLDQIELLQQLNVIECQLKGCHSPGKFFINRLTRPGLMKQRAGLDLSIEEGDLRPGLYCMDHEKRFGLDNLKRWAKEIGGIMGIMVDDEGSFEAVIPRR